MAKFLKSIFTTSEKRKSAPYEGEEERDFTPPLDGRRKLSISRSGRMKQANKKRHSLALDLYGKDMQPVEKPKTLEYHVNKNQMQHPVAEDNTDIKKDQIHPTKNQRELKRHQPEPLIENTQIKTPEEEIENAFGVIDEVL